MEYVLRLEKDNRFTVIKWEDAPIVQYIVRKVKGKWTCSCPHAHYRHVNCKHRKMVLECIKKGIPQPYVVENF